MLPPCTRVEDTVLDLIQVAPTFDDAIHVDLPSHRPSGAPLQTGSVLAMAARKKMRWRQEIALALGDAADGALV